MGRAMTSALLLILSGVLIGAGLSMVLRDTRRLRRGAFALAREATAPGMERSGERSTASATGHAQQPLPAIPDPTKGGNAEESAGRPSLAEQWALLEPSLDAGVTRANALLAPEQVVLGASSAADWSYRQRGYGAYRRLLLGRDSIAWLRLELTAEKRLHASLKAHRDDRADINATAQRTVEGFNPEVATDLLLECLRLLPGSARQREKLDAMPSEQAWQECGVLGSALKATNGALAQAGARIVPLQRQASEPARRMSLRIEVNGNDVARMHIERLNQEMEVAVGMREARLTDLARRRRLPLEGLTIHALAELIAGCAWPAIAHYKDVRRPG
jgi:hypothetical protein